MRCCSQGPRVAETRVTSSRACGEGHPELGEEHGKTSSAEGRGQRSLISNRKEKDFTWEESRKSSSFLPEVPLPCALSDPQGNTHLPRACSPVGC